MYQPWSFWLAWAIIIGGFVVTGIVVVYCERRDARERNRWLSRREFETHITRARWIKEMTRADSN